jgi:hypothetical protein
VWTRPLLYAVVLIAATLTVACNDSGNTTIINEGIDCLLVRDHLVGTWTVDLATATPSLQNCTGLAPGLTTTLTTVDFPATYANVDIFGSDGSTSFKVLSDRSDLAGDDAAQSVELTGTVQADSCLAMIRVWDQTNDLYFQCIGGFAISNLTLSGECDSAEIDTDANGQLDTSCSLSDRVQFDASVN